MGGPTIVEVAASNLFMSRLAAKVRGGAFPTWQVALCLLLAALVVYNPYLSATDSSVGLCVRHSASFRATLGASELQHFTPKDSAATLAATATIALVHFLKFHLPESGERHTGVPQRVAPPQQALPASLWFRPPPAR
jgi:hypothetical protein